jgi:hypothetical protein
MSQTVSGATEELRGAMDGPVIVPGDPGCDDRRPRPPGFQPGPCPQIQRLPARSKHTSRDLAIPADRKERGYALAHQCPLRPA